MVEKNDAKNIFFSLFCYNYENFVSRIRYIEISNRLYRVENLITKLFFRFFKMNTFNVRSNKIKKKSFFNVVLHFHLFINGAGMFDINNYCY